MEEDSVSACTMDCTTEGTLNEESTVSDCEDSNEANSELHDGCANAESGTPEGPAPKKRKSYSREMKLAAINYYSECKNKYSTAKKFCVKPSTLRGWLKHADKIRASHRGTRKVGCGRKAFWPDMEEELHRQYRELRDKGLKVKYKVLVV